LLSIQPPFLLTFYFLNFLEAIELSAINAAAFLTGLVPCIGAGQIPCPKRPASALARPNRINHTPLLAIDFPQKNTILGARVFDNRRPQTVAFQEFSPQLPCRHLQKICDYPNLRPGDPYIPLTRPGAASPALHTFKMQPASIPASLFSVCHDLPLQDRPGVGAGRHRGVLGKVALCDFWYRRLPGLFTLG
jgi:hypothetical protein